MRLFVAVRPSAEAAQALAAALARPPSPRWHLTLAFLGEVEDPGPVAAALRTVRVVPFRLALSGGGTFGGRVLWAGVGEGTEALAALATRVRQALDVHEERPFRPHLTLARGRDLAVPPALAEHRGPAWTVDRLALVQSPSYADVAVVTARGR